VAASPRDGGPKAGGSEETLERDADDSVRRAQPLRRAQQPQLVLVLIVFLLFLRAFMASHRQREAMEARRRALHAFESVSPGRRTA
jgi:hypothetical protein